MSNGFSKNNRVSKPFSNQQYLATRQEIERAQQMLTQMNAANEQARLDHELTMLRVKIAEGEEARRRLSLLVNINNQSPFPIAAPPYNANQTVNGIPFEYETPSTTKIVAVDSDDISRRSTNPPIGNPYSATQLSNYYSQNPQQFASNPHQYHNVEAGHNIGSQYPSVQQFQQAPQITHLQPHDNRLWSQNPASQSPQLAPQQNQPPISVSQNSRRQSTLVDQSTSSQSPAISNVGASSSRGITSQVPSLSTSSSNSTISINGRHNPLSTSTTTGTVYQANMTVPKYTAHTGVSNSSRQASCVPLENSSVSVASPQPTVPQMHDTLLQNSSRRPTPQNVQRKELQSAQGQSPAQSDVRQTNSVSATPTLPDTAARSSSATTVTLTASDVTRVAAFKERVSKWHSTSGPNQYLGLEGTHLVAVSDSERKLVLGLTDGPDRSVYRIANDIEIAQELRRFSMTVFTPQTAAGSSARTPAISAPARSPNSTQAISVPGESLKSAPVGSAPTNDATVRGSGPAVVKAQSSQGSLLSPAQANKKTLARDILRALKKIPGGKNSSASSMSSNQTVSTPTFVPYETSMAAPPLSPGADVGTKPVPSDSASARTSSILAKPVSSETDFISKPAPLSSVSATSSTVAQPVSSGTDFISKPVPPGSASVTTSSTLAQPVLFGTNFVTNSFPSGFTSATTSSTLAQPVPSGTNFVTNNLPSGSVSATVGITPAQPVSSVYTKKGRIGETKDACYGVFPTISSGALLQPYHPQHSGYTNKAAPLFRVISTSASGISQAGTAAKSIENTSMQAPSQGPPFLLPPSSPSPNSSPVLPAKTVTNTVGIKRKVVGGGTLSAKAEGKQKMVAYVEVPLPPAYVVRDRTRRRQTVAEEEVDHITSPGGTPVKDPQEEIVRDQSITRLQNAPCKWGGCNAVLNSAAKLAQHLKNHVGDSINQRGSFHCSWQHCGRQEFSEGPLLAHVDNHAYFPLRCPYDRCKESFRSSRQLLQHARSNHSNDQLRPSADPFVPPPATSLLDTPDSLPSYMVVTRSVTPHSISKERHEMLAPWVLKNMMPSVDVVSLRRYKAARQLRARDGPATFDDEFVASRSSHSCMPSRGAKIRDLGDLNSDQVSQLVHDGLTIWQTQPSANDIKSRNDRDDRDDSDEIDFLGAEGSEKGLVKGLSSDLSNPVT